MHDIVVSLDAQGENEKMQGYRIVQFQALIHQSVSHTDALSLNSDNSLFICKKIWLH
jgi:hypothetical protein